MSTESTVLLLEAESLPGSLEEQLAKRNVFVEHASHAEVGQVLPVVVPDLLVQSGEGDLSATLAALSKEDSPPPLVVIADRNTIRSLRESQPKGINALIPQDLPIAAVAHRLATMARRSAEGAPIDSPSKARPIKGTAKASPTAASKPVSGSAARAPGPAATPQAKRGSLAPGPLAPRQQVKIVDPEEGLPEERGQAERPQAAPALEEVEQRAAEEARAKRKAEAEAKSHRAAAKRRAEIERRAEERTKLLEEKKREQEKRLEERRQAQERKRQERLEALARKAEERAAARARASLRPTQADSTPSEVRALDELFPTSDTPEPKTKRISQPPVDLADSEAAAEELEQTTQAVNISAFASDLDREAKRASERATAPLTKPAITSAQPTRKPAQKATSDDFDSVEKTEDLSVILPLPVDMRVDLSPQNDLKPVRLALLDIDLTRADSIAAELREKGMKIHPVTPDPARTRWPMLRRFSPQGLIVDEKSMARGAAEWVETFRGDPFLRHVPVVLVRFSRLFDESTGKVTLEPLLHMIEHIGREEFALLEKLGPGRRVDLWLSQVTPFRLVEMLTQEDRNTRLDCKSQTERMVWHLGPGYAGKGKLADLKTDAPKSRLSPEEALSWLLGHEDCQVAVHEHAEPLAHASESKDAEELLREMTEALAAPERHESVRPGALSEGQRAPSFPGGLHSSLTAPDAPNIEAPSRNVGMSGPVGPPGVAPPPPLRRQTPEEPPIELPLSRKPLLPSGFSTRIRTAVDQVTNAAHSAYGTYERWLTPKLAPLETKIPASILRHTPWASVVMVVFIVTLFVGFLGGEDAPTRSVNVPNEASENAPETQPGPPPEPKPEASDPEVGSKKPHEEEPKDTENIWKVRETNELPSCEKRLGPATPKGTDPVRATSYWKNARRSLMVGNTEEAIESMCLAGLLDPAGPASEGLAEYYLGQRSLTQAERWIRESLKADPERRKSQELLSDIENQKGNVDEARMIILKTMRVSADETKKMEITARKLRQDARLARKGGDLPRAERELRRAALLAPKDAEIAAELGDILLRRQAPDGAARWAAHALELDPNYSEAMILSGRIAEVLGKKDKARSFYEMVPTGDPLHDEAQRRRARL